MDLKRQAKWNEVLLNRFYNYNLVLLKLHTMTAAKLNVHSQDLFFRGATNASIISFILENLRILNF
jgi:hypothetical protein